jgi:glycosyltransferase involved in cell wall biosynthesis
MRPDPGIKEDPVPESTTYTRPRTPRLAIVVPCHDEEEVLPATLSTLTSLLTALAADRLVTADSFVWCVDDGSRDRTWGIVCEAAHRTPAVRGMRLTRNFGKERAMLAGLLECEADVFVTIDADLQDDESRIRQMLYKYREGYDVVYGVRASRDRDSWFKRNTALAFYRFVDLIGGRIVHNHADFRLMSRAVTERLREFRESNLFLRGLIPMVGLPQTTVKYDRRAREAGETKYAASRLFGLAWEAITSLTVMPLRFVSAVGATVALLSLVASAWAVGVRFLDPGYVPGWASTLLPILLLGGVQILCMGIIGEYVGKIYLETKQRPRYLVGEKVGEARPSAQVLPFNERRQGDRRQGDRRRADARNAATR